MGRLPMGGRPIHPAQSMLQSAGFVVAFGPTVLRSFKLHGISEIGSSTKVVAFDLLFLIEGTSSWNRRLFRFVAS